jgi:L-lactate dehydrogenase complex protein LldG
MTDTLDLIAQFTAKLASAGGTTHHVASPADAAAIVAELANGLDVAWASPALSVAAPGLVDELTGRGVNLRFDGNPTTVRDQALGIAIARNTIAETGSSLLVEPTLGERSVSLMTETLIVLCKTDGLLPGLDAAAPVLREVSLDGASYATLVTGPSRTADIERQLTVGVQGPAVFHVILVDDL